MRAQFGGLDDLSPTSEETLSLHDAECGTIAQLMTPVTQHKNFIESHAGHVGKPSETTITGQTRELVHQMSNTIRNTHRSLKRSRLIHLFYIVLLLIYTLIGAVFFQRLDGEEHDQRIMDYKNRCNETMLKLDETMRLACDDYSNMDECRRVSETALKELNACFHAWHSKHVVPTLSMSVFIHAAFYAFSVYTTIGYGNVACESSACRHGTTLYAIIGIPLFFAFLHEMSNVMGHTFMRAWIATQRTKKRVSRWRRSYTTSGRLKGGAPQVFIEPGNVDEQHDREMISPSTDGSETQARESDSVSVHIDNTSLMPPASVEHSHVEPSPSKRVIFQHDGRVYRRESGRSVLLPSTQVPPLPRASIVGHPNRQQSSDSMHMHREQRRVFVGAILTFVVYLVTVSALMAWMENWSFTDAFYFLFTSVALIGFGDVFPDDPTMVLINCAFIVFGIALFGMCYFILQEEIRLKASQATRHARRSISRYRMAIQHRFTPSPSRRSQSPGLTALGAVKRRLSAPALAVRSRCRRRSPNGSVNSGSPPTQSDRKSRSVNEVNQMNETP